LHPNRVHYETEQRVDYSTSNHENRESLEGKRFLAVWISVLWIGAISWASAEIPGRHLALGANTNENFEWATPQILERTHTTWVRGFFPASEFISGKRSYSADPAIDALKSAAASGHKVILSIKWDSKDGDFGPMPGPGSERERLAFDFVDKLLDSTDGQLSALVVINELSIDTLQSDLAPGADGKVPVIAFLRRVVQHIDKENRTAPNGDKLPIFAGGMTRLDLSKIQQSPATKAMIRWINQDAKLTGADFHLHEPSLLTTETALRFIHQAIPDKPLMTTEFSLVFQWKAHLGDKVGKTPNGRKFSNAYGLRPGITVAQFLTQVFDKPVPAREWHEFLASQPWFDGHFLMQMIPLLKANGVKIATYGLTSNPNPVARAKPVTEKTTPWFLNSLLVPGMIYDPGSTNLPENYELFRDYVSYQEE
jgi:hypothetical protein